MKPADMISVEARPEPFKFAPRQGAVIVVDMQNGFASRGGFLDLAGYDISGARGTVANCQRVLAAARQSGMHIIYLQMGWQPGMHDAGVPHGANWHKSIAWRFTRAHPDTPALVRGTWDYAMVEELAPQEGDIVIPKTRQSGFFETNLDSVLRTLGVNALAFVGIATNVCVEATLRDAVYRDYLCLLIEDAANANGPEFVQKATSFNVQMMLGWVSTTSEFVGALSDSRPASVNSLSHRPA
jgi:ureidoacrylate peracid hydrolase